MNAETVRTTLEIEPALHQALQLKAASTQHSISELVNDAIRAALLEDKADLAAFEERAGEELISYEEFLARLRADGTL